MSARSRHPHLVAGACRLYSVVVWTYPAALRHEYRREMLLTFKNQTEDVLNSGGVASVLLFVLHIAADWLRTLASEPEDPMTLSLLGLGARDGEGCGCLDRSTFTVGLLLATLGVFLLIAGWYEWFSYKALFLSHHRIV